MRVILAEKPDMGRKIAEAFEAVRFIISRSEG